MLDVTHFIEALKEAAVEGVNEGLRAIQARAQDLAPVRDIFRHGRGRLRKMTKPEMMKAAKMTGAFRDVIGQLNSPEYKAMTPRQAKQAGFGVVGQYPVHEGRQVEIDERGNAVIGGTRAQWKGNREKVGGRIRGRPNSYAPVIPVPVGGNKNLRLQGEFMRIGGVELRSWAAGPTGGALEIGVIRSGTKSFRLSSLLSTRGRYEVATGRAVTGKGANKMVGGTLREGIVVEEAVISGDLIYGYVAASAHDPGRTHNYAADQEFGSRHNKAQPFLRPALRETTDPTRTRIRRAIRRGVESSPPPKLKTTEGGLVIPVKFVFKKRGSGPKDRWGVDFASLMGGR